MPGVLKTVNPDGARAGHFLSGPFDPNRSSEEIVIAIAAPAMDAGTVLGKVTASGQYVPYNPAGADGSQNFAGILYDRVEDSTATQKAVAIVRHQVVNANLLTFVNALNAGQLATMIAAAAQGVILRY